MYCFHPKFKTPVSATASFLQFKKKYDFRFRQYTCYECYGKIIILIYFYIFKENFALSSNPHKLKINNHYNYFTEKLYLIKM